MILKKLFLISIPSLFFLLPLQSQVTIGSELKARDGYLLELKENDNTGNETIKKVPNSTKGLGLPRVELSSLNSLTIDGDAERDNYVGLTVYNITDDNNIAEGVYTWEGTKWKQSTSVDGYGSEGQLLIGKSDNTYGWSTGSVPSYKFHKPTQISAFDSNKAKEHIFSYQDLTLNTLPNGIRAPKAGIFDDKYVYSETLNVKTDANKPKYLLLGLTVHVKEPTVNDWVTQEGIWQIIKVEVLINNEVFKSYQKVCQSTEFGKTDVYIDWFSIISVDKLGIRDDHDLKIRVSNIQNSFPDNAVGYINGSFDTTEPFYYINLTDISFALYEDE